MSVRCLLLLIWMCTGALAGEAPEWLERLPGAPPAEQRVQQIDKDLRSAFDAALHEYDNYLVRSPYDVASQLRRCAFIDEFIDNHEYVSFAETLTELSEDCRSAVRKRFPEHPEVTLDTLERNYGKRRLQAAERALEESSKQAWTNGQLARLYTLLANTAENLSDTRSAEFARLALTRDERADVRLLLARKLSEQGRSAELVEVLTARTDGHDPDDGWYLVGKMELLAAAEARPHVLALYSQLRERHLQYDGLAAARVLRAIKAITEVRWELDRLQREGTQPAQIARERFRLEFELGTSTAALAAYNQWRARGWAVDPLAINRVALLLRQPLLPWQWRDLIGIGLLVLCLASTALLLCLPVALVHYRGLARRAQLGESYPQSGWRLRDAWFGLFAFVAPSVLALYCAGPLDVQLDMARWGISAEGEQLARIALFEKFLTLPLLVPLLILAKRYEPRWWATQWGVLQCLGIGIAMGLLMRVPLLSLLVSTSDGLQPTAVQQPLWQLLGDIRDRYGVATALWLLALFAPLVEEFVFRGVLLNAFAAHLRFGWANIVQAALFAAMHMDARAAPGLFLLALAAGWLARRSGGLLAPMALHSVFNLVLSTVLLRLP